MGEKKKVFEMADFFSPEFDLPPCRIPDAAVPIYFAPAPIPGLPTPALGPDPVGPLGDVTYLKRFGHFLFVGYENGFLGKVDLNDKSNVTCFKLPHDGLVHMELVADRICTVGVDHRICSMDVSSGVIVQYVTTKANTIGSWNDQMVLGYEDGRIKLVNGTKIIKGKLGDATLQSFCYRPVDECLYAGAGLKKLFRVSLGKTRDFQYPSEIYDLACNGVDLLVAAHEGLYVHHPVHPFLKVEGNFECIDVYGGSVFTGGAHGVRIFDAATFATKVEIILGESPHAVPVVGIPGGFAYARYGKLAYGTL